MTREAPIDRARARARAAQAQEPEPANNDTPTHPPPIALTEQETPNDLQCSICLEVPLKPSLTPCDHLFCSSCITEALTTAPEPLCPNCQSACPVQNVSSLQRGSLIHRIWSGIRVSCRRHDGTCTWKGPIGDYESHLEHECEMLHLRRTVSNLTKEAAEAKTSCEELREEKDRLEADNQELRKRCRLQKVDKVLPVRRSTYQVRKMRKGYMLR